MDVNATPIETESAPTALLEPELSELLAEFLQRLQGKSLKEIMPILSEFKSRLPKDTTFSEEQKSAIIERALEDMPEDERARYKTFLKMFAMI